MPSLKPTVVPQDHLCVLMHQISRYVAMYLCNNHVAIYSLVSNYTSERYSHSFTNL